MEGRMNDDDPPPTLKETLNSSETYVVRIPRDQVYRVPPPENARIVESHRNPTTQDKKSTSCCGGAHPCCCCILATLAVVALLGVIFMGMSHFSFHPKSPEFHLASFSAKNLEPQSKNKHNNNNVQFEVKIVASNPNSGMDVRYKLYGGKATLVFKQHAIGEGRFRTVNQESETSSSQVDLTLDGTRDDEIQSALIDDSSGTKWLTLKIEVDIEMKNWMKTMKRHTTVTCDFKVNSLNKNVKILSESCQNDF